MSEILKVFNQYKKRKFETIQQEVEKSLLQSYDIERENWDALSEEERGYWKSYGEWWNDYIDSPYDGAYEYINELHDRYWSKDEVFLVTLNANAGLDPKTVYDEVVKLVFGTMAWIAGIEKKDDSGVNFLNWDENPFEV